MSAEDNKQAAMDGYAAFSKGDAEAAMAQISDSVQWVVGGDSSVTGTYTGKQELGGFWAKIGAAGLQVAPSVFVAEGDTVMVRTTNSVGGDQAESIDVLTYDGDGQLAKFETFGGEDLLNKSFPR
jgi:ketosteroid isomerase-like protein